MKLQLFYSLFSHLVLEYLSCGIHGEPVNEINVSRTLVLCHTVKAELLYLVLCAGLTGLENDTSHYLLTVVLIGNADDLYVLYLRIGVEEVLDLLGVDILTASE